MDGAISLGVLAISLVAIVFLIGRNRVAQRTSRLYQAYACYVVTAKADTRLCDKLWFSMTMPKFVRLVLEDTETLPLCALIVWSANMAQQEEKLCHLLTAPLAEARFAVLAIDATPPPESLQAFVQLENTSADDIAWQWRVKVGGAPADHVHRPG